jgi:hypothetical protein
MHDEDLQNHTAGKRPVIMVNEADVANEEQETQEPLNVAHCCYGSQHFTKPTALPSGCN